VIGTEVKADVIREFLLTIITGKSRSSNIYIYTHGLLGVCYKMVEIVYLSLNCCR